LKNKLFLTFFVKFVIYFYVIWFMSKLLFFNYIEWFFGCFSIFFIRFLAK
jgi:hypothetical protein